MSGDFAGGVGGAFETEQGCGGGASFLACLNHSREGKDGGGEGGRGGRDTVHNPPNFCAILIVM